MSGKFEGLDDLLKLDIDTETENHRVIEGEISENVSLLYDVTTNEYMIESDALAEKEEYDDTTVVIDPATFEGFEIGKCRVTKEDLTGFMDFIQTLRNNKEI